jgi:NAD(P)-dependent dehydrogenase (short-subunit alcohol dehydrogenase family)
MNYPHVLELFRLEHKAAIVTGASKGLGYAIALALAQAGSDVLVTSRNEAEIKEAASKLAQETGRTIVPLVADTRSWADAEHTVEACRAAFGKLDILVNNVGMNNRKPIHELSVTEFAELLDTNLTGTFRMCKAAAETMMEQQAGRVINLSSMLDRITIPGRTGYAASKGGVLMLTKTLALEWAALGIRVNAISPGPFATPMNETLLADPARRAEFLSKIPLGRFGKLHEIGAAAVYLASEASGFMTGTSLYIDGGWTAQ